MSFVSIIKTIGKDLLKGFTFAAPGLELAARVFAPAAAGIIDEAVNAAEQVITTAASGAAKKESATQIIMDELPAVMQTVAGMMPGKAAAVLGNPAVQAALSEAIDATVAGKNAIAAAVSAIQAAAK